MFAKGRTATDFAADVGVWGSVAVSVGVARISLPRACANNAVVVNRDDASVAIALATALLSPAALAQKGGVKGPPELPRTPTQAPIPNSPEQTMRDLRKPVTKTTEQADTTLPPPSPQS